MPTPIFHLTELSNNNITAPSWGGGLGLGLVFLSFFCFLPDLPKPITLKSKTMHSQSSSLNITSPHLTSYCKHTHHIHHQLQLTPSIFPPCRVVAAMTPGLPSAFSVLPWPPCLFPATVPYSATLQAPHDIAYPYNQKLLSESWDTIPLQMKNCI